MDRVAARAQLLIILRLEIEAAVEIERRTALVEAGTDPGAVGEHEIDLLGPRQERPPDGRHGYAFGAFALDPFDLRHDRMGLDRDPQDNLVLDHETGHGLAHSAGLRGKNAEQQRNQAQKRPRSHLVDHIVGRGFAAIR